MNINPDCENCDESMELSPPDALSLDQNNGYYQLTLSVECHNCGFSTTVGTTMQKL